MVENWSRLYLFINILNLQSYLGWCWIIRPLMERQMGTGTGLTIQELLETAIALSQTRAFSFSSNDWFCSNAGKVTDPLNYARYWFLIQDTETRTGLYFDDRRTNR